MENGRLRLKNTNKEGDGLCRFVGRRKGMVSLTTECDRL